jgi:hypothetical protein
MLSAERIPRRISSSFKDTFTCSSLAHNRFTAPTWSNASVSSIALCSRSYLRCYKQLAINETTVWRTIVSGNALFDTPDTRLSFQKTWSFSKRLQDHTQQGLPSKKILPDDKIIQLNLKCLLYLGWICSSLVKQSEADVRPNIASKRRIVCSRLKIIEGSIKLAILTMPDSLK